MFRIIISKNTKLIVFLPYKDTAVFWLVSHQKVRGGISQMDLKEIKISRNFLLASIILLVFLLRIDIFSQYVFSFVKLLSPLLVGVGIAFLLNKPVILFERFFSRKQKKKSKIHRVLAIISAYALFILFVLGITSFVVPQLISSGNAFYQNIGRYQNNLENMLLFLENQFGVAGINIDEVVSSIVSWLSKTATTILPNLLSWTSSFFSVMVTAAFSIVISFYLLYGKENNLQILRNIVYHYGGPKFYKRVQYVYHITIEVFNKYIIGQLTEACILALLCYVGMKIFRFDYSLIISVLIGVTALVPIVGAYVGGGIAFFLLLIISPIKAVLFLVYLIVLQQLENNFIYPHVVGTSLGLPPLLVMLAIILGGGLFGFVGMLIGVPIMAIIYTLIKNDLASRMEQHTLEE